MRKSSKSAYRTTRTFRYQLQKAAPTRSQKSILDPTSWAEYLILCVLAGLELLAGRMVDALASLLRLPKGKRTS